MDDLPWKVVKKRKVVKKQGRTKVTRNAERSSAMTHETLDMTSGSQSSFVAVHGRVVCCVYVISRYVRTSIKAGR
jgi:hypothetical protein